MMRVESSSKDVLKESGILWNVDELFGARSGFQNLGDGVLAGFGQVLGDVDCKVKKK